MNNNGVAIRYGNVAPGAKENFFPSASEAEFDTLSQLQLYNATPPNYANPCELYSVVLDGKAVAFPSMPDNEILGLISEQITDDDGKFAEPIVLELVSEGQYSSQGLTLTFDTYNGIFPTQINVKWIRITSEGIETLADKDFEPNSAFYFCNQAVENYNKVVITFYSLNMPKNRLRLRAIDYGYGTFFYGAELRNVKLIQEIDPISTQISINTADFTLDSDAETDYSFQAKQPLSIYFNGELKATTFVKTAKRQARFLWQIQSEDYIGLLDSIYFKGGVYENKNAVELLTEIFEVAKIPFTYDASFEGEVVSGYIPYATCREAIKQVAFAIQAVVDTSDSDFVKIFALEDDVKQTIPLDRIMQGQSFEDEETVTGIEVTVHSYKPIEETLDVYDATKDGTGENIIVKFSEPLHDLTITNGEIVSREMNYAVINANEGCLLTGQKYEHTTQIRRKNNPVVLASELEKIVAITQATLVSNNNIDKILEKCYNWLVKTNTINMRIVEGKHISGFGKVKYGQKKYGTFKYGANEQNVVIYDKKVSVGDVISTETEYLGVLGGRIIKQSFNLNGGIIIKEAVLK